MKFYRPGNRLVWAFMSRTPRWIEAVDTAPLLIELKLC